MCVCVHVMRGGGGGGGDNLTHQGQFLMPDSQIQTSFSKNTSFHFRFVMLFLNLLFIIIAKTFKCPQSV